MGFIFLLLVAALWFGGARDLQKKGKGFFVRNAIAGSGSLTLSFIVLVVYFGITGGEQAQNQAESNPVIVNTAPNNTLREMAPAQANTDTAEKQELSDGLKAILTKRAGRFDAEGNLLFGKFATVSEMMEDFGDFYTEAGTFELLSEQPLHIRLSPVSYRNDAVSVVREELKRAMIYGIYRTLLHTDIKEVTVTVRPQLVESLNPYKARLIDEPTATISKSREQALIDLQEFIGVVSLREALVTNQHAWTKEFNQLRFNDQGGAGLDKFYNHIAKTAL